MRRGGLAYSLFVLAMVVVVVLAAVPIVASDLFREPYSPAWRTIYDALDLFHINPYPTGGGQPPRFPYWRDPAGIPIYYQNLELETADHVRIAAWYVPSTAPGGPTAWPTVFLGHGLMDSKTTMLPLVPWLHEAGYNVMLIDFRGNGDSQKVPTTIGRLEALDVQAALDWLDDEGVGGCVGGLGMSLGAASLVNAAARDSGRDSGLDALVLDSLFATWNGTDFAKGYRLPPDWLVPDVPSPVKLMPQIHVPVFFIAGTADILVGVENAYQLYDAANEPKFLWVNDSGHAWSAWTYPELYESKVLSFFADYLTCTPNHPAQPTTPP